MKKTIPRIVAFTLCLMMCLSALPMEARAEGDVAINETNFPDKIFREYVCSKFDKDGNGLLSQEEREDVYDIWVEESNITSLIGIEHFPNLKCLYCDSNKLTTLDVSKNIKLERLSCGDNKLTTLDISKNTQLSMLICSFNELTSLDVSKNTELKNLQCHWNYQMTSLDVSNNKKLEILVTEGTPIRKLDVSKNTELTHFVCDSNKLTTLDVSKNTKLDTLLCYNNNLTTLDIHNNPILVKTFTEGKCEDGVAYWIGASPLFIEAENLLWVDSRIEIIVDPDNMPSVTAQPKNETVAAGKPAAFCVEAAGDGLTYQWFCQQNGDEWELVEGETKATLSFAARKSQSGNKYFCAVCGKGGRKVSDEVKLTVIAKPIITTQPKAAKVKAGKKVTFKVKATGVDLKYQWYRMKPGTKKWVKINKATKATYSFKAAKKWNGYKYKCLVKNKAGSVYSKAVKLTVK